MICPHGEPVKECEVCCKACGGAGRYGFEGPDCSECDGTGVEPLTPEQQKIAEALSPLADIDWEPDK